jgi:hypothetical protein|tara:strand:- start:56762 stop:57079 length:318 start_codon:yes stop_codon:yes gene_type:complete
MLSYKLKHNSAVHTQIIHSSWNETTGRHKTDIIENIGDYFYSSKGAVTNSQWSAKLLSFERVLNGTFDFARASGSRFISNGGNAPFLNGPSTPRIPKGKEVRKLK